MLGCYDHVAILTYCLCHLTSNPFCFISALTIHRSENHAMHPSINYKVNPGLNAGD